MPALTTTTRTLGARLLYEYVHRTHGGATAFAAKLAMHPQNVWYWSTGRKLPRTAYLERIELLTGGFVPRASWLQPDTTANP